MRMNAQEIFDLFGNTHTLEVAIPGHLTSRGLSGSRRNINSLEEEEVCTVSRELQDAEAHERPYSWPIP